MRYLKRNSRELALIWLSIFILTVCVNAQKQENQGYLSAEVASVNHPKDESASFALWVVIQLRHQGNIIGLTSDESGVIDEKLPAGDYTLISASELDGTPLPFLEGQGLLFTIRKGKTTRFAIGVIESKEQQDSKFGRFVAKLEFVAKGQVESPSAKNITIRLEYKDTFYEPTSNELGLIDEKLPVGDYTLISAKSPDGTPLLFKKDQNRRIRIEPGSIGNLKIIFPKAKE
jgi:hypothetical protein